MIEVLRLVDDSRLCDFARKISLHLEDFVAESSVPESFGRIKHLLLLSTHVDLVRQICRHANYKSMLRLTRLKQGVTRCKWQLWKYELR